LGDVKYKNSTCTGGVEYKNSIFYLYRRCKIQEFHLYKNEDVEYKKSTSTRSEDNEEFYLY
jgi:hypothetical protein